MAFGMFGIHTQRYAIWDGEAGPPWQYGSRRVYRAFCTTCIADHDLVLDDPHPICVDDTRCDCCGMRLSDTTT